jgi:hypothetical protein
MRSRSSQVGASRWEWLPIITVALLVLLLIFWDWQMRRPECPHDSMVVKLIYKRMPVQTLQEVGLSGPISGVPEFHDCQRFVGKDANGSWVYGALYAIFAAFKLDSIIGYIDSGAVGTSSAVATIYSYGTYDALGIGPGFNCLILVKIPPLTTTPSRWLAQMVKKGPGPADSDCRDIPTTATKTPLAVAIVPVSDPNHVLLGSPVPPVARWDWDATNEQQYIGIKCGGYWCQIGNANAFQPSPGYSGPALTFDAPLDGVGLTPREILRVTAIKGWYDDQWLAVLGASGGLTPSTVHGYLVPHPALDRVDLVAYAHQWAHVAYAVVDAPYKGRFLAGANKILMCHGTPDPTSCNVPITSSAASPTTLPLDACEIDAEETSLRWYQMIIRPPADTVYQCIKRRDHGQALSDYQLLYGGYLIEIPGASRWRWLLSDEGEWAKCGSGCCTGPS